MPVSQLYLEEIRPDSQFSIQVASNVQGPGLTSHLIV